MTAALAGSVLSRLPAPRRAKAIMASGASIGRYRITRLLGAGGMGVVYAAHDPELGRDVAVKVLHPEIAHDPDAYGASLLAEARALAQLRHPNVVAVFDAGTIDDRVYVAMELIAGQTLRAWLETPRPWSQVVDIMRAAGRGLAAAHAAGLVHRDFKPENVLLGDGGEVCVSDFGLALQLGSGEGDVAGTPMYMAPEQRRGESLDARTDQYAFGLVLCEALSGLRPAESVGAAQPRDRYMPPWLRRVCARAISIAPEARFASMNALLERLDRRAVKVRRGVAAAAVAAVAAVAMAARISVSVASPPDPCRLTGELPARLARPPAGVPADVLERWNGRWSSMRIEACQASEVRGVESSELFDLRMACLDREAGRVGAVLDELVGAHAGARGALSATLASTDGLDACAAGRASLEAGRLPTDPAQRATAQRLGSDLAAAEAAVIAGRSDLGISAATAVADQAAAANLQALRADALLVVGRGQVTMGELPAALSRFREVIEAAEQSGHEPAKVAALVALAETRWGVDLTDEAEHDLRVAAAVAARLDQARLSADVAHSEALMRTWTDDLDAALAAVERGIGFRRGADGDRDSLAMAELLDLRATVLTRMGRGADARAAASASMDMAIRVLGPGHPRLASLLVTQALIAAGDGHNAAALVFAAAGAAVVEDDGGIQFDHPAVVLAELMALLDGGDDALATLDRGIARHVARGGGVATTATLGAARGRLLFNLGRAEEAIAESERAAASLEHVRGPESLDLARALEQLGHIYVTEGRPALGLARAQRALAIRRQKVSVGHPSLFDVERTLGRAYLALGQPGAAVPHLEAAAANAQVDPLARASTQVVLGRAMVASGGDRQRAIATVRAARATLAAAAEMDFDLAPIDRWLASVSR